MSALIQSWLEQLNLTPHLIAPVSAIIGFTLLMAICLFSYYFAKNQVLHFVHKLVLRSTNQWDDLLVTHKVFNRFALLVPVVIMLISMPFFISENPRLINVLTNLAQVAVAIQVARSISAVLNVANSVFQHSSNEKYVPLNATIQLLKLAVYLVAFILAISVILNRSPIFLLSGLGALTAVLLLIFQDTIKGLVASIQISANKMVAPGDWIEMSQYGADGEVLEIALNTVKVKNWDNTITTVPTYALISESFKNWRGMSTSGGRRIKRSINLDINSIKFCSPELLQSLAKFELLGPYLTGKNTELEHFHQQKGIADLTNPNSRHLTNIGTFRAYILAYLQQHPKVHHGMTCMVRQLKPTEMGIALELYFFSNDTNWANFEGIQADVFDHLLAVAKLFELKVFQSPSGQDWRALANN